MTSTVTGNPTEIPEEVGGGAGSPEWGSDVVVDLLRNLGIEYMAVMPGSTTRGIHDSVVNYAGNTSPELIVANHEMTTVSMARGYARVAGKPMAALVHNVVGLLNTTMTVYDAYCDRVPVLILGGTGPMDTQRRRPRIDWIHTANVQGNLVRDFTKWDDQPASVGAIPESILRAYRIAMTPPRGPVYVCLDVELQEQPLREGFPLPDVQRYLPGATQAPDPNALTELASWLVEAELPLVFADRMGHSIEAFQGLIELAELLAAPVVDLGNRLNFPTPHPLEFTGMAKALVADSDVVLGLDVVDLYGQLRTSVDYTTREHSAIDKAGQRVATISLEELVTSSWSADYQGLATVDLPILADTKLAVPMLVEECRRLIDAAARTRIDARRGMLEDRQAEQRAARKRHLDERWDEPEISEARLLAELWDIVKDDNPTFTAGILGRMASGVVEFTRHNQFICGSGGGAVGASPGVALGAALALKSDDTLPVGVHGDGALWAGISALWTAAHYEIPSLWIVNNNRTYYNDENHQERIARYRDRPDQNGWIGQRMENPEVDFASVTRAVDLHGEGPIRDKADLRPAIERALEAVRGGSLAVVDVWTGKRGRP